VGNKRNALRAGTVAAGTALLSLLSSPAFAVIHDDGEDPGPGISVGETIGLYVVTPIVLFLLIAAAVSLTDKSRKQ
jgi:hypothetical protein